VADLVVDYGRLRAVDRVSFAVAPGGITAVLGPNGAGKTTTVEVCEGLRPASSGVVRVFGTDPRAFTASHRARIGVMLQSGGIPSAARAVEFVHHIASLHANPLDPDLLCERLGLHALGRTPYRRLSGGQKQTVALATAIVGRPELLMLDEPTAGLDPAARVASWELITDLREAGVSIVMSTHFMEEAERLADQVLVFDQGRIVARGSVAEITGGTDNHVRITTTAPLDDVSLQRALGDAVVVASRGTATTITGSNAAEVSAALTTWCSVNGVVITSLSSGQRTLEDVFFEITGRGLTS
jgi:ABC-2 type transport system ATP-binding protein